MGRKIPKGAYGFDGSNLVEGLHKDGYDTWCIGGVTFFDKRTALGKVFPSFFEESYWNPSFSSLVKESTRNQVDFIIKKLEQNTDDRKIFLYLNVSCIHYPNYFYADHESGVSVPEGSDVESSSGDSIMLYGSDKEMLSEDPFGLLSNYKEMLTENAVALYGVNKEIPAKGSSEPLSNDKGNPSESSGSHKGKYDNLRTHRAALRYADDQLGRLFDFWKNKRGKTFVICFSDHGTCYGEDGYVFHRVNHPVVCTVPYKHFFL